MRLGRSHQTIAVWLKQPLYQSYENWVINKTYDSAPGLRRSKETLREEVGEFAAEMFDRLRDIVETTTDQKFIKEVAFDMLDRADVGAPKRETQRPINFMLTAEAVMMLQQRARESSQDVVTGEVIKPA
jgi:hypothetical protein